jgi:NitT/TauT family transport system substrate-binding protein
MLALGSLSVILAGAVALGVSGIGLSPRVGPQIHKLTLALASTPHAALLHMAAAKGYFFEEGLDVTFVPVSHGKAALDQLAQGKVDLAAAAEVPFVISVLQGEPFAIAANMLSVSTEMALVARRDSGVAAPRDLVGKRIGATLGTSGEYFLWAFLIRHKLAPERITLVDLSPSQMAQALAQGEVDAVAAWQPVRLNAESALGTRGISFTEPDAYTVTHVVVGRQDFLKRETVAIEKLVRALLKAERFNRDEPQQALDLFASRMRLDPQVLQPTWRELGFRVDLRQSQLVTLEDEARWAIARGHAPRRGVPNFLAHVNIDALLAVRSDRVTIAH